MSECGSVKRANVNVRHCEGKTTWCSGRVRYGETVGCFDKGIAATDRSSVAECEPNNADARVPEHAKRRRDPRDPISKTKSIPVQRLVTQPPTMITQPVLITSQPVQCNSTQTMTPQDQDVFRASTAKRRAARQECHANTEHLTATSHSIWIKKIHLSLNTQLSEQDAKQRIVF